jgi:mycoredoxin
MADGGMFRKVRRFIVAMSEHGEPEFNPADLQPITVYWRPGCGFCSSLLYGLERQAVPFSTVNIWDDPDGAAYVRSIARGNETVPTVAIGDLGMVNPSVQQVIAAAQQPATAAE